MSEEFIAAAYWEKHLQTANTQNPFKDNCIFPVGKFLFSDFKHTGDVHHVTYRASDVEGQSKQRKKRFRLKRKKGRENKQHFCSDFMTVISDHFSFV